MVGFTLGTALNWLKIGSSNAFLIKPWFQTGHQFHTNRITTPDNAL
jgi:hypothetical protein